MTSDLSDFTYPRLLQRQVSARPQALAVVTPTQRVTWQQLGDDVTRHGAALTSS